MRRLWPFKRVPKMTTLQKKKRRFSIKDFFRKCQQISTEERTSSHLLNASLTENFIFCEVQVMPE